MFDEAASSGVTFSTISDGGHDWRLAHIPASTDIVLSAGGKVEYLIVAPGGPGGNARFSGGGGGSAGDVLIGEVERAAGSYPAVIGTGAPRPVAENDPSTYLAGGPSSVFGIEALAGGRGAGRNSAGAPGTADSGHYLALTGGAGTGMAQNFPTIYTVGTAHPTAFAGGNGSFLWETPGRNGGGGRGAGGNGQSGTLDLPGAGGAGVTTTFTGTSLTFGRGGNGGTSNFNGDSVSATTPGDGGNGANSSSQQRIGGGTASGVIYLRVRLP